jgi:hypothetical protein
MSRHDGDGLSDSPEIEVDQVPGALDELEGGAVDDKFHRGRVSEG